jgi:membrane protease YdiL (CAAX protease family)
VTANAVIGKRWAGLATGILTGVSAGITFLFGALIFAGVLGPPAPGAPASGFAIGVMVTAGLAAVVASNPARERVAGILHVDPDNPVHTLALVLTVILLGLQIAFLTFVDVLAADQSQPPLTVGDLFAQELPFLIIAFAGIGLWTRRNALEAAARLGVVKPAWWQITLALGAAGVFFAFSQGVGALSQALTPQVAHNVDVTTQHVFGGLNNPAGIAAIALLPAICEEILFRGALQPRLGLVVTALLFTSIHTQYSISFDTLAVFLLALGLGLIRKYTNTTTSAICHATYNLLVSVGVGGDGVAFVIAAEVALVVPTAFGVWSVRRRRIAATPTSDGQVS